MMLRWLSRVFAQDLDELAVTGEPDPVVDAVVARSAAAQESIAGWLESKVDCLITALAAEIAAHADELAVATVAETGIGCVHPGVSMILATGGTAMVKAAYSSGTPAIGVGPGNAPAWVCIRSPAPPPPSLLIGGLPDPSSRRVAVARPYRRLVRDYRSNWTRAR